MRTLSYICSKDTQEIEKGAENENSGEITLKEFMELVKMMRHQQRRYFATRNKDVLAESIKLEQKVDSIIAKMNDTQMSLF